MLRIHEGKIDIMNWEEVSMHYRVEVFPKTLPEIWHRGGEKITKKVTYL